MSGILVYVGGGNFILKKIAYYALGASVIAMSIMGCSRNDNYENGEPANSGTVEVTSGSNY